MIHDISRFSGTESYITSPELRHAVNVSVTIQRPLLVRGEPGTGKTLLAQAVAEDLGLEQMTWNVKSTSKAADGLYVYDTVQRLQDSRFGDHDVSDIRQYIHLGPLGRALTSELQVVLLIDEIDKADLEFPNDLLHELDVMEFSVIETGDRHRAVHRPIVVITSNAEKELPDPFLRRCIFHFIEFPDQELMTRIVHVHHPTSATRCSSTAWRSSTGSGRSTGCANVRRPRSSLTGSGRSWLPASHAAISPKRSRSSAR